MFCGNEKFKIFFEFLFLIVLEKRTTTTHIHTRRQYSAKDLIKTLRRSRPMNLKIWVSSLSFLLAFLCCFNI